MVKVESLLNFRYNFRRFEKSSEPCIGASPSFTSSNGSMLNGKFLECTCKLCSGFYTIDSEAPIIKHCI